GPGRPLPQANEQVDLARPHAATDHSGGKPKQPRSEMYGIMDDMTGMDEPETRTIGRIPVSVAGLGCNNFGRRIDEERSRAVVTAALDAGVTTFDTAESYGDGRSEEHLGRALGARRGD